MLIFDFSVEITDQNCNLVRFRYSIFDNFDFCSFDIKEYVSGFGNPDWEKTHDPAAKSALVVTWMLKNGATFVGKTVMDELAFG